MKNKKQEKKLYQQWQFWLALMVVGMIIFLVFTLEIPQEEYDIKKEICEDYQVEVDNYQLKSIKNFTLKINSKFAPGEERNLIDALEETHKENGGEKYDKLFYGGLVLRDNGNYNSYEISDFVGEYCIESYSSPYGGECYSWGEARNETYWNINSFEILSEDFRLPNEGFRYFSEITIKNLHDIMKVLEVELSIEEKRVINLKKKEIRQNCTEEEFYVSEKKYREITSKKNIEENCSCSGDICPEGYGYYSFTDNCRKDTFLGKEEKEKEKVCIKWNCGDFILEKNEK